MPLGIVTALAVAFHEIPQEIGDFGILIYSGFEKIKALFLNFLSAITIVFGGVFGLLLNPIFAAAAMAFSSLSVVLNSLRLKVARLLTAPTCPPKPRRRWEARLGWGGGAAGAIQSQEFLIK